jgi:hypothetical protein
MTTVPLSALFGQSGELTAGVQQKTEEVSLAFGKVNLSSQLATYFAGVVEAPFIRKSAMETGQKVSGSSSKQNVSNYEGHGAIYSGKVRHNPNAVILLQTSWKRNGVGIRDASVFIRLRNTGPMLRVDAMIPTGRESSLGDRFVMFLGRGDVMGADDLEVLGIHVPVSYQRSYMQAQELAECFDLSEVFPETIPRPTIARVAVAGETRLVEMPSAPRRRIRLGR